LLELLNLNENQLCRIHIAYLLRFGSQKKL
jgi:hypothetical protein